ncbi:glutaredoxin family protein [Halomontanus rarus]|uniref:glutaredoxin family protein n=1 Tax=Halomontanus rarus TaxID=3034020 RepID=UPI0023E7B2BF|nr:glutathione S-transferase N-terminal domain-containing protein [Halovivax sp. TS33]
MREGSTADAPITFYRLQGCPFCERVTRLLQTYDLEYQSRFVEPLHSKRNVVKRVAGVRTVPVVVDENTGVTMAESGNIVDYLERVYGPESEADAESGSNRNENGNENENENGGDD